MEQRLNARGAPDFTPPVSCSEAVFARAKEIQQKMCGEVGEVNEAMIFALLATHMAPNVAEYFMMCDPQKYADIPDVALCDASKNSKLESFLKMAGFDNREVSTQEAAQAVNAGIKAVYVELAKREIASGEPTKDDTLFDALAKTIAAMGQMRKAALAIG